MMTKRKSLIGLLVIAIVASLFLAFIPLTASKASANTSPIVFDDGAYIRVDTNTEAEQNTTGIRFTAQIDSSIYGKEVGMIIVPNFVLKEFDAQNTYTDYFEFIKNVYGKDKETVSKTITKEELEQTNGMFCGVIATILDENYNEEYGAVAYYVDGETYHYTRSNTIRRIADVANTAIQTDGFNDEQNEVLANVIKKAITLTNDGNETPELTMAVGKTVDLGQVITDNYISAYKNVITWEVTSGADVVKLGFLDNIQAIKAGNAVLTATAYDGKVTFNVNVTVTEATKVEDALDFVVEVPNGEDIRVLQITDTQISDSMQDKEGQFGNELIGSKYNYLPEHMENNAFKYIRKAVADANPHLIILTGDNVYGIFDDAGTSFEALVEVMDSFGIPWGVVYGNHDNESAKGALWQNEQLKKSEYCLFNQGVVDGNGNYTIGLKQNGEIVRVCYLMDSNYCGAGYDKPNNNVIPDKGFTQNQMAWYVGSISQIKGLDADLPVSMYYHVPDVNFGVAQEKYLDAANGAKYYTIGANVKGENGDFGANLTENGEIGEVEMFDVTYDGKTLLEIYTQYGVDSVFVGHKHSQSMSILHEGIRWTFGLKTGIYDHIPVDMMGGTLATIGADGAISVKHLYFDDAYAAQMEKLQDDAVNGLVADEGIPLMGENGEIVRTNSMQKTFPVSVEYVADKNGDSSVAYRFRSHTNYVQDTHFIIDLSKYAGSPAVKFKFLVKDGEFTKEMGATKTSEIVDGRYVVNGTGVVMAVSVGGIGTFQFNEEGVDDYGAKRVYYTVGEWLDVEIPLIDGDKRATSFGFMVSTASTIYLKDIVVVEPEFTVAEEGQTLSKYVGDTIQLTTTGVGLTYSSDNNDVATVSDTGLIECVSVGSAVITVTDKYGVEKTLTVTVSEVPADAAYYVNYYVQSANGVYVKDEELSFDGVDSFGTEITAETPEKSGYVVNTEKSTLSGLVQENDALVLEVYYAIDGLTFTEFVADGTTVGAGSSTTYVQNSDGTVTYTGIEKSMATITHANCEYIMFNKVADKDYLFITVKYNEGTDITKNWGITVTFGAGTNRDATVEYKDVYVLNAKGKFVPNTSSTIVAGETVTYVIDLNASFKNIDGGDVTDVYADASGTWKVRFNYDKAVNVTLYNNAFLTSAQAEPLFSNEKADYTVNYYMQAPNGTYVLDESATVVANGKIGDSVTATTPEKTGYVLDSEKSTISGFIQENDALVLNIYYTIDGVTFNEFDVATGFVQNADGTLTYEGVEKTMATITHADCHYVMFNKVADKDYLFVTVKYNEGTNLSKNWGIIVSFGGANNRAVTVEFKDVYVLNANGKFVPNTSSTIVAGEIVTYVIDLNAELTGIDGDVITDVYADANATWKVRFNYDKAVNLTLYNYAFLTSSQAEPLFSTEKVNYTVNYYMQAPNGTYVLDESATVVESGNVGDSVTAETPEKSGYVVNTEKSTLSGLVQDGDALVLEVYYVIDGVTFTEFVADGTTVGAGAEATTYVQNSDGTVTYTGIEKTMATITHANCEYIMFNKVADKDYLFITVKYNEGTDLNKNWGIIVTFGGGTNRDATVEYKDVYVLNAKGKFVPNTSSTIVAGETVTYVIDLNAAVKNIDGGDVASVYEAQSGVGTWKVRFNYDKAVNVTLYNHAFLTSAQAEPLFSTEPANYTVNYYMQAPNGTYVLDESAIVVASGKIGDSVTATTPEKTGYVVNTEKSTISGIVQDEDALVLNVYYEIEGSEYADINVNTGFVQNADGTLSYEGVEKTMDTITHANCHYVMLDKVADKDYLFITVKYNEGTDLTKNWGIIVTFGGANNRAVTVEFKDVYVLNANGKLVPNTSATIVAGETVTYVIDLNAELTGIDGDVITDVYADANGTWKVRFNYDKAVNLTLYNHAFLTSEQANAYLETAN